MSEVPAGRYFLDLAGLAHHTANNPFRRVPQSWGSWRLTRSAIGRVSKTNTTPFYPWLNGPGRQDPWTRLHHVRRIRYFVDLEEPFEPIEIEASWRGSVAVVDGFHRIAAGLYRGMEWIDCVTVFPISMPTVVFDRLRIRPNGAPGGTSVRTEVP